MQKLIQKKGWLLGISVVSTFALLWGCSTTSTTSDNVRSALAGDEDDYRETEETLKPSLEVPPDLISPSQNQQAISELLNPDGDQGGGDIPLRQLNGVKVKTNLSERWIELPITAEEQEEKVQQLARLWQDTQNFLISLGFEIDEADQTLGMIRTKYKARSELAPIDAQGPLTRLLNSWRPEMIKGVYDRLTARVETDLQAGMARLYFYDQVVFQNNDGDTDQWIARPYSPELEAEALYQALIFFGVTAKEAFRQIDVTQHLVQPVNMGQSQGQQADKDAETLKGVLLKAPFEVAWTYTKAMLYRAGWQLVNIDEGRYQLKVRLPEHLMQEKSGFFARLFSKSSSQSLELPESLIFTLQAADEIKGLKTQDGEAGNLQFLTVEKLESEEEMQSSSLTEPQQTYIFKALGFLRK